jgi:hypothetical protein
MLPGPEVDVKVTVSPVKGSRGVYEKNGLGAANAGPATRSAPRKAAAKAKALTP